MYETFVYLRTKLSCMVVNSAIFISEKEINNVVEYFRKSPHIEICSQLIEAPEQWLLDNEYREYQKPEKIKRVRELTGLGLKDAKDLVEKHEKNNFK